MNYFPPRWLLCSGKWSLIFLLWGRASPGHPRIQSPGSPDDPGVLAGTNQLARDLGEDGWALGGIGFLTRPR